MRRFHITVNGQTYEVEVEEVGVPPAPANAAPSSAATSAPAVAIAPAAAPAIPEPAEIIRTPMPGTIVKVNVAPGDAVRRGGVLCVLEAMKMENEIMSPRDAVVAAVMVWDGATVDTGDGLIALAP